MTIPVRLEYSVVFSVSVGMYHNGAATPHTTNTAILSTMKSTAVGMPSMKLHMHNTATEKF